MKLFARTPIVVVACQPKSASTFLCGSGAKRSGGKEIFLSSARGRGEHEFDRIKVWKARRSSAPLVVSHQHICHSTGAQKLIEANSLSVVVLRRNLFDVVCSIRDHLRNEGFETPVFFCNSQLAALPDEDLEVLIARMAIPWYLKFHLSWKDTPGVCDVDFEEVKSNPNETVERIFDRFAFPVERRVQVGDFLPQQAMRFNRGETGRGKVMSKEAIGIVRTLVRSYADIASDPWLAAHLE